MAEKYYAVSPYAYCNNNSIRFVDPTGNDDYEFNSLGKWIKTINDDPYDRLIAGENSLIVKDKSLMGGMTSFSYKTRSGDDSEYIESISYSVVSSENQELMDVFRFMSDNTEVEWLLLYGEDGNSVLATNHLNDRIKEQKISSHLKYRGFSTMGGNPIYRIHSHPKGYESELKSMGHDFQNVKKESLLGISTQNYVYFPETGNIYHIRPSGVKRINR